MRSQSAIRYAVLLFIGFGVFLSWSESSNGQVAPLIEKGQPSVNWWFVFKFNTKSFPECVGGSQRACLFGGEIQDYPKDFGQQFIVANSGNSSFQLGLTCLGDTTRDPVGATFEQVYNGSYYYVIWTDQFYNDPDVPQCLHKTFCDAPWAHSKGMLAWDDDGNGFVMQVSTPNWPGAGNKAFPRQTNGNTLGCIIDSTGKPQNNVWVSQHFFSVKLIKNDVLLVLEALKKASVVTERNAAPNSQSQIVKNGGPSDIQERVRALGKLSEDTGLLNETLSSGVKLIAKPPLLHVPPWQMISALLGGESLVVATWLTGPRKILDTDGTRPGCWDPSLGNPGPVRNAESGVWNNISFGLTGGASPDRNHAKIGVSKTGKFAIFGDLNQEGSLSEPCDVPQNTRGGLFFVVADMKLADGLRNLMDSPAPKSVHARIRGSKRAHR
jgi:hypothetical protein